MMNALPKRIEPGEYTGQELRDLAPELYAKKFEGWQEHNPDYEWWDSIYDDLANNPQYYHPEVDKFFTTWQPQIKGGDLVSQQSYHALAEYYMGVITDLQVSEFDLYPRKISLHFDLSFKQWVRDQSFPTDNPLFINVLMDWVEDDNTQNLIGVSSGTRDFISYINDARDFAAEWYIKFTGSELAQVGRGWRVPDEVYEFGDLFEKWVDDNIDPMIDEFIEDVERIVLAALDAEYEYLSSEDCFLNSYVHVDEDDLEEIEDEHA